MLSYHFLDQLKKKIVTFSLMKSVFFDILYITAIREVFCKAPTPPSRRTNKPIDDKFRK